ncbi:glutaredoxin family protein [Methylotuvimicrobium sp. KM2]|uniref:glutaredoxin family protein n=1 Tax=Methylotuvimicrobium sp. KM2 TaxID=3133976 RepID=UPI0031019255
MLVPKLMLFGTQGCHLCEQAEEMLASYLTDNNDIEIEIESIDIAEYEKWQERYAIRIPVLLHEASGIELCWPFDQLDVEKLVAMISGK